jgi:dCTP deaminase
MSIKSDRWIRRMAIATGMIDPFSPEQVRLAGGQKIVSYGTSSYGYDVRCADEFKIFTNINSTIVDPKSFDEKSFVDFKGPVCIIPPNSFALASTVEFFRIPRSVLTVCLGKSTYARCGIIVNVTPLEPEWEGHVTLEFSNTTPLPTRASRRCCFSSRTKFAKPRTGIVAGSTRGSAASRCQRPESPPGHTVALRRPRAQRFHCCSDLMRIANSSLPSRVRSAFTGT